MNRWIKVSLYVVLVALGLGFGVAAKRHYNRFMRDQEAGLRGERVESQAAKPLAAESVNTDFSRLLVLGGAFMLAVVGFSLLFAHDVSQYLGGSATKALYNDEGEGIKNPEWELAEEEWAKGNHLEAVRLMREYLQKNPREQWAALRIAEIYEKDLSNYLAAALEYEEVLKHKLPAERWAWAAIHLANLYSGKLEKPDLAVAWLRRIVKDYGRTAAAKKARDRLGMVDVLDEAEASDTTSESGLPPGFGPRSK
jgi:tetratricopeptide (TPR) repeat protein